VIAAVLDTNVLVSGFPGRQGAPAELVERWLAREFQLIVSEHILDGAIRAWNTSWFRARFPRPDMEQALYRLRSEAAVVVPATGIHGIAPDDEDDLVLATAVAGNADYLVTGDRRFRATGQYEAIAIRSPREFVTILDQERLLSS
jgi:putative PIN family toxin of toxin-antitoxin system